MDVDCNWLPEWVSFFLDFSKRLNKEGVPSGTQCEKISSFLIGLGKAFRIMTPIDPNFQAINTPIIFSRLNCM